LNRTLALTGPRGSILAQYTYEPFGNTLASGPPNANPYQDTGRENDGTTGLYFYRARYYSPTFQRFTPEDPIGFSGGFNLYAYVGSNPTSFATAAVSSLEKNAQNAKPRTPECAKHKP